MRIVTINTGRNAGNYLARIDLLARQLSKLSADVVLAQEVFASTDRFYDTGASISRAIDMMQADAPARGKPRTVAGDVVMSTSGLAVFSRWPILSTRSVPLPTSEADGGRMMQVATIEAEGRNLRLINLHLSFLDGDEGDRMRIAQWDAVLDEIAYDDVPTLIAGDFNAAPDSRLMRRLLADKRLDFGPDDIAATAPTSLGGLLEVGGGGTVIDHVIALRPHLRITSRRVTLTEVDPVVGSTPSDHAAVEVEIAWVS